MSNEPIGTVKSLTPAICYKDPKAAIVWLQSAFGFELALLLTTAEGEIAHCEVSAGGFDIGVMHEWSAHKSAPSLGGATTHLMTIRIGSGIDAHCERARAAGAQILEEPQDQFYGERTYRAADPEGNVWRFGQAVRDVSREEMERSSGLKFKDRL
jgi:uncharacterized glyoxalase superfamily protein PhnB